MFLKIGQILKTHTMQMWWDVMLAALGVWGSNPSQLCSSDLSCRFGDWLSAFCLVGSNMWITQFLLLWASNGSWNWESRQWHETFQHIFRAESCIDLDDWKLAVNREAYDFHGGIWVDWRIIKVDLQPSFEPEIFITIKEAQ
jgi:hypothetical protein